MKFYFIFIVFILFFSCNHSNNRYISTRYEVVAEEILKLMKKKLSKKYDMQVISERAGLAKQVNLLGLGFEIKGPLSQEELRSILVGCVQEFLFTINNNEEIRPYLNRYPFTVEGIQIDIFVVESKRRKVFDPYIRVANALQGNLKYKTIDRSDIYKYKSIVTETYDQALKLVEEASKIDEA